MIERRCDMERLTIDEVIKHARKVAENKYAEGMLCHANPNDDLLDGCIKCAEEHEQLAEWLEKLKAYEQAEEDGLLIRLPCKVGDTLYTFNLIKDEVIEFRAESEGFIVDILKYGLLGRTTFLTKAEAEQALAKMKGE